MCLRCAGRHSQWMRWPWRVAAEGDPGILHLRGRECWFPFCSLRHADPSTRRDELRVRLGTVPLYPTLWPCVEIFAMWTVFPSLVFLPDTILEPGPISSGCPFSSPWDPRRMGWPVHVLALVEGFSWMTCVSLKPLTHLDEVGDTT